MATRRPLVLVDGLLQELPAGDDTPAPGAALAPDDVTGTTYTFVAGDLGRAKRFTNAAGCSATVPTGLGAGWTAVWERAAGAGALTFVVGAALAAANGSGSLVASVGRAGALVAEATDVYLITGQLGAAAGGGSSATSVTVSVVPAEWHAATRNVVDALVSPSTPVLAWLAPNDDWDADDLAEFELVAAPGAGSINFTVARFGPIVGDFAINYKLG